MASTSKRKRGSAQAKKEKRQLKKLADLGLIKSPDFRKARTLSQRRALRTYADVLEGRAKVVRPKQPSKYKDELKVVRGKVIVPRTKGERIDINRQGEIVSVKRTRKGKVKTTRIRMSQVEERKRKNKLITVAVPFRRKGGGLDWRRFTLSEWRAFLNEYKAKQADRDDWDRLVLFEEHEFEDKDDREDFKDELDTYKFGEVIPEPENVVRRPRKKTKRKRVGK